MNNLRFGELIRLERRRLGLNQQALADRARMSKAFISDVENGKRGMSVHRAKRVARVLDMSIDALMAGEDGS